MKYLKVLGLAAVAAMAVTAFVGAGTASAATKLCATSTKKPEVTANGCPTNKEEPAKNASGKVHIEAESTEALLTTSITNVTCDVSKVTIEANSATNEGNTSITGEVTSLSFSSCETSGGTECTVTVKNLPYEGHLLGTTGGNTNLSTLTVTDAVGAGAQVVCGFLINCTFTTKEASLAGTNGSPTTFKASKVLLAREGGFCPATAEWDATYKVVTPVGLTVH